MDDVSFSYDEEPVLRDICLSVERGEFIAFVGPSGAGKSSIISLLARMYEPDSGAITANGIPIEQLDLREWRDRLAFVRQDPYIFNDSLRYNITLGKDVSRGELQRVSEIALVSEFVDETPDGYDTVLGDDGVRLSGGQRQRVALARALLQPADLLLLDEATSDLDSNIEEEVQNNIESMERDYAIVSVAHRLSTVKNADRIYTIEAGEIVEFGTHNELLEKGDAYANLYSTQKVQS
jgi:subfamily B ATP-binding cassette protein MsbA